MYTSENNIKTCLYYGIITAFFAMLGFIYELFSHQVYSLNMIYAFTIPLIAGLLPSLMLSSEKELPFGYLFDMKNIAGQIYAGALLMFTMGNIIKGVLDIYGTTNSKLAVFPAAGVLMLLLSFAAGRFIHEKTQA